MYKETYIEKTGLPCAYMPCQKDSVPASRLLLIVPIALSVPALFSYLLHTKSRLLLQQETNAVQQNTDARCHSDVCNDIFCVKQRPQLSTAAATCSMQVTPVMCATTSSVSSSVHNRLLLLLHHAHAGHHSDVCNNIFCVKQRPQLSTAAAPCSMHDATVMCATTSSVSSSVHNRLLLLHHAQCRTPQ